MAVVMEFHGFESIRRSDRGGRGPCSGRRFLHSFKVLPQSAPQNESQTILYRAEKMPNEYALSPRSSKKDQVPGRLFGKLVVNACIPLTLNQ